VHNLKIVLLPILLKIFYLYLKMSITLDRLKLWSRRTNMWVKKESHNILYLIQPIQCKTTTQHLYDLLDKTSI